MIDAIGKKQKAVERLENGEKPATVAKDLGLNPSTVRTWNKRVIGTNTDDDETELDDLKRQLEDSETELKRQQTERERLETQVKRLFDNGQSLETKLIERERLETALKRQLEDSQIELKRFETEVKQIETVETPTIYDKRALFFFCSILVVINALVILPPNLGKSWDIILGSVIVCFLAPFVEFKYSAILIEIWDKLKKGELREGVLKHLYKEWFAVTLLLPAMIFQSRDVFQLVYKVLNVTGIEIVFPVFIAFSFQLYGLMQTLHLPKQKISTPTK